MIEYLYNNCYGGFAFSEEFEKEFDRRFPEKAHILLRYGNEKRYDPDVVALWKEMGNKASAPYSKIVSKLVPEKYIQDVEVTEYDGMESVCVDWSHIYTDICHRLVSAIKNGEDTSAIIQEHDEAYAQQYSKKQ